MRSIIVIIRFFSSLLFLLSILCCNRLLDEELTVLHSHGNISGGYIMTRSDVTLDYLGHHYVLSNSPLSIDEARVLFSDSTLTSTHRALRITPQTMDQVHKLEANKLLLKFYHPFGYQLLPDESEFYSSFSENNEISEDAYSMLGGCGMVEDNEEDHRVISPIYVLWPYSTPISQDVKCDTLFDAFLNSFKDGGTRFDPHPSLCITGHLLSYDNRLGEYTPIKHVQLSYHDNFEPRIAYTDSCGYFSLPFADVNYPLTINLQNDKFIVRDNETSNVKSLAIPPECITISLSGSDFTINLLTSFFLDVYKAAEYYFYENNDLLNIVPKYDTLGVSIDIHAINAPNNDDDLIAGAFHNETNPYIEIWNPFINNYSGKSSLIFGTVNHELAHATNRAYSGQLQMVNTPKIIKESFASFLGWYNVSRFYYSLVGTNHNTVSSICGQGRQGWFPTLGEPSVFYSPIYIDLFDNYNQGDFIIPIFNNDPISDVPIPFIVSSALGPLSFPSVVDILSTGVGVYYTSSEFSTFISPYSSFLQ